MNLFESENLDEKTVLDDSNGVLVLVTPGILRTLIHGATPDERVAKLDELLALSGPKDVFPKIFQAYVPPEDVALIRIHLESLKHVVGLEQYARSIARLGRLEDGGASQEDVSWAFIAMEKIWAEDERMKNFTPH